MLGQILAEQLTEKDDVVGVREHALQHVPIARVRRIVVGESEVHGWEDLEEAPLVQ
ncbi:hypothetical protein D3C87_1815460 [compost metagenome]